MAQTSILIVVVAQIPVREAIVVVYLRRE